MLFLLPKQLAQLAVEQQDDENETISHAFFTQTHHSHIANVISTTVPPIPSLCAHSLPQPPVSATSARPLSTPITAEGSSRSNEKTQAQFRRVYSSEYPGLNFSRPRKRHNTCSIPQVPGRASAVQSGGVAVPTPTSSPVASLEICTERSSTQLLPDAQLDLLSTRRHSQLASIL